MTKSQELRIKMNELLDDLKLKAKYQFMVKDGIINEEKYLSQSKKVLFIAKDPNHGKNPSDGDFREWWNSELKWGFSKRIGEWAYGILNDFPDYEKISDTDRLNALQSIAFINLKKAPGISWVANQTLEESLTEVVCDALKKQIQIINPDIIICCVDNRLLNIVIKGLTWQQRGDISCVNYEKSKVLSFYHPSNRGPSYPLYLTLEKHLRER